MEVADSVIVASATKRYATCNASRKHGAGPCTRPAGWGTDHAGVGQCKLHGGMMPNNRKHAATLTARQHLERLNGQPLTPSEYIDPVGALLSAVTIAALMEAECRRQVMELESLTGEVSSVARVGNGYDVVPTSEDVRAIVKLHVQWHDQLVKAGKACVAARVDERMTRLAQAQGAMLMQLVLAYMSESGYTPAQIVEGRKRFAAIAARMSLTGDDA